METSGGAAYLSFMVPWEHPQPTPTPPKGIKVDMMDGVIFWLITHNVE